MKLYTIYKEDEKVVYSTFAEGETHFFYAGFSSAEEAKEATFNLQVELEMSKLPPVKEGCIQRPMSMTKTIIKTFLQGEWTEIE